MNKDISSLQLKIKILESTIEEMLERLETLEASVVYKNISLKVLRESNNHEV